MVIMNNMIILISENKETKRETKKDDIDLRIYLEM